MDGVDFFIRAQGSKFLGEMGLRDQNNGEKIGIIGSRIYHVTTLLCRFLLLNLSGHKLHSLASAQIMLLQIIHKSMRVKRCLEFIVAFLLVLNKNDRSYSSARTTLLTTMLFLRDCSCAVFMYSRRPT